jgi:hypothetical protein
MPLVLRIKEGETPLQAAFRYAEPYGLEKEVEADYNKCIAAGDAPAIAAFNALWDWDCLVQEGEDEATADSIFGSEPSADAESTSGESIEATTGEEETPLEWAIRCAKEHHLQFEVEEYYHRFIAEGQSPEEAATNALVEWDV